MGRIAKDDGVQRMPESADAGQVRKSAIVDYYNGVEGGVSVEQVAEHFNITIEDAYAVLDNPVEQTVDDPEAE